MKTKCIKVLSEYNYLNQKISHLYSKYASKHKISESTLNILYSLYVNDFNITQSDISKEWGLPLQTVNTCLKSLEKEGYLLLLKDDRRRKNITLTIKGEQLMGEIIMPLIEIENQVFQTYTESEQEQLILLTKKQLENLQKAIEKK